MSVGSSLGGGSLLLAGGVVTGGSLVGVGVGVGEHGTCVAGMCAKHGPVAALVGMSVGRVVSMGGVNGVVGGVVTAGNVAAGPVAVAGGLAGVVWGVEADPASTVATAGSEPFLPSSTTTVGSAPTDGTTGGAMTMLAVADLGGT